MSVDRNVVGRVGEDEVGMLALQQAIERLRIPGIATQQPVPTQEPDVATSGHR